MQTDTCNDGDESMSGIFSGNVLGSRGMGDVTTLPEVEITADVPSGTGTRVASFMPGDACTADNVVRYVQAAIGTTVDGKWGPKSQAALKASGQTFQQIAQGCKPPVPSYTASGYQPPATTPATTIDVDKTVAQQAGFSDLFSKIPPIAWLGAAGIAALLLLRARAAKKRGMA